jgi:ABC-type Fe3+/spermidine/putrescine transport system ATPase subunit
MAVYVTHDQAEALSISDRMAVLRSGIVQQVGTPQDLYENPANPFVAEFLGGANLLGGIWDARARRFHSGGMAFVIPDEVRTGNSGPCTVAIKPECLRLVSERTPTSFGAILTGMEYQGFMTSIRLRYGEIDLRASVLSRGSSGPLPEEKTVLVEIDWSRCSFFQDGR